MPFKDHLRFYISAAVVMAQKQILCFVDGFSLTAIVLCGVWGRGWRLKARHYPRLIVLM